MSKTDVDAILNKAAEMPNSLPKLSLLEEAIEEIDRDGDMEYGYYVRLELMEVANFTGFYGKLMSAFTWCLDQADNRPDEFDEDDIMELMWRYKWVVENITYFPQVPLKRITELQDDMARRFVDLGYSDRSGNYFRCVNAMRMGNLKEAARYEAMYRNAPLDELSDCSACELNKQVEFQILLGNHDEAIELAGPIIKGQESCAEIPHLTLSHLIWSYYLTDKKDAAKKYHKQGFGLIRGNFEFIGESASHILYRLLSGDENQALTWYERFLPWTLETNNQHALFMYYSCGAVLFDSLNRSGKENLTMLLDKNFPFYQKTGEYNTKELAAWFDKESLDIASKFDKRNGNQWYHSKHQDWKSLLPS